MSEELNIDLTGPAPGLPKTAPTDVDREAAVRQYLEITFALPPSATEWLLALWRSAQFFDDLADGDPVSRSRLDRSIWDLLISMPANPFFAQYAGQLLTLISVAVLKWQASDRVERAGGANARTFTWRDGYFEIVLAAIEIVHGRERATDLGPVVLAIYGENFDAYMKEHAAHA